VTAPSLTSTLSFRARMQRSERGRIGIMMGVLCVALTSTFVRRAMGGAIMANDTLFMATMLVLLGGLLYQGWILFDVGRHERMGTLVAEWRWKVSAAVDVLLPLLLMYLLQLYSPDGPRNALAPPALLFLMVVLLLSILRLRPRFSLFTGLAGALGHALLVIRANAVSDIDPHQLPMLFTYSVVIAIGGVAAALVSKQVKRYVLEAVAEATDGERAKNALDMVERDLAVARDIQMGLMPTTAPSLGGFDIVGLACPAQQTGGDYFDWQPLPDGRLAVVLADVTGHGIGPALVMAVCRAYARATAPSAANPGALLDRINSLIHTDLQSGRFITMVLALLDERGGVELISAGHGPTLLYRAATGEIERFGGDGLPLGIAPDVPYGPHRSLTLARGDVLVLLTDGFAEWARPSDGEQFGINRLVETLGSVAKQPAKAILEAYFKAVRDFVGIATQPDDMTAVVMKRN